MKKIISYFKSTKGIIALLCISILILILIIINGVMKIPDLEADIIQRPKDEVIIKSFKEKNESNVVENKEAINSISVNRNQEDMKYIYDTKQGIVLKSDSKQWKEDKLKLLYEELISNTHGEEIKSLREVIVHAKKDKDAAGTHQLYEKTYEFDFDFPAIPNLSEIEINGAFGSINLYDGDNDKTIQSQAYVLSHEYGHHYTYHYMFVNDDVSIDGDYAKARKLNDNKNVIVPSMSESWDSYLDQHHWYLQEIAADDYVQLMGSKTAKNVIDYADSKESLYGHDWQYYSINGTPQENFLIPLAYEVDGLYEYYHSFVNKDAKKPVREVKDINISIKPRSVRYHLSTGYRTFNYYEVTWNKPYVENGIAYTLVVYNSNEEYDYPMPLKTVYKNENAKAIIGTYAQQKGNYITWSSDDTANGTKYFVVTVTFKDGTIIKSAPKKYTFN